MQLSLRSRGHFTLRPTLSYLTFVAALCWSCSASDAATDPAPIACTPSTLFYGDDGNWSPILIDVGIGQQSLSVLPNTVSQETWVIGPGGCDTSYICQQERGGLFDSSQSSTWTNLGDYRLGIDPQFKNEDYGDYGLDVIALNNVDVVSAQIVSVLNTTDFWLGMLGLGVQHPEFSDSIPRKTFLSSLVEDAGLIPSHSYGYTAGAYYRINQVPVSLTLGGVDTNRFIPNSATFVLDVNQKPNIAVNKITVSASATNASTFRHWASNPLTLLAETESALFAIDSSTPFLWFPEAVCDSFADALGLVYNDTLQLYLFDDNGTSPTDLSGLSFDFSIGDSPGSSTNTIKLSLPYSAFNLQLSFPFPGLDANSTSAPTNYFPLRKATAQNQYTLGRAFLQETYLTVDYERNNFSISQAIFRTDALTNINLVAITRPENSNYTGPYVPSSPGVTTGVKAGAAIGVILLVTFLTAVGWYIFRLRKSHRAKTQGSRLTDKDESYDMLSELPADSTQRSFNELPGSRHFPAEAPVDATHTLSEMPTNVPVNVPIEMAALEEVPAAFLAPSRGPAGEKSALALAQNRVRPLSIQKSMLQIPGAEVSADDHIGPIPPPYSPADVQQSNGSTSISPNSTRQSGRNDLGTNTSSSSERVVSPVTPSSLLSRSQSGPESATGLSSLPRLQEQALLDGYRIRGRGGAVESEEGMELHERTGARRQRFSWEGSEV